MYMSFILYISLTTVILHLHKKMIFKTLEYRDISLANIFINQFDQDVH